MKKWMSVFGVCFVLATAAFGVVQSEPAALVVVEIRGLDQLVETVQALSAATMGMPLPKEQLEGPIGQLLMTPDFAGLDRKGLIRIYLLSDSASKNVPAVLSLPVLGDGSAYLDLLAENMDQQNVVDGIEHFRAAEGARTIFPELYVKAVGGQVLLSQAASFVAKVEQLLSEGRVISSQLPVEGAFAVEVELGTILNTYGPQMEKKMAEIKKLTSGAKTEGQQDVGAMLDAEYEMVQAIARQVDRLVIGWGVKAQKLESQLRVEAVEKSMLAEVLASIRTPSPVFQQSLPENALLAEAGHWGNMDIWLEPYGQFIEKLYGAMGPQMAPFQQVMTETLKSMKGLYSGDIAIALLPPTAEHPIQFVEVLGITDAEAMKKVMATMLETFSKASAAGPAGMAAQIKQGESRMHGEVAVDSFVYTVELPAEATQALPPVLKAILQNMKYEMAYLEGAAVVAMGPPEVMDATIDRFLAAKGTPIFQSPAVQGLFPELADAPMDAGYVHLMEILRDYLALSEKTAQVLPMLPPVKGTLASVEKVEGNAVTLRTRLGLADLQAFFQAGMVLKAQFSPVKAGPMGPGTAPMSSQDEEEVFESEEVIEETIEE